MTSNWLDISLSIEQLAVFNSEVKNKCILAGSGSGKTKTLVYLILKKLEDGINPSDIVAFTFTNKAADEILSRVIKLAKIHLPHINLNGIFLGTIHSWCFKYLSELDNYINFSSLDELQQFSIVARFYDILQLDKVYSKSYPNGIKDFLIDIEIYYNECISDKELPQKVKTIIPKFEHLLIENRLLTFGSMIKLANIELENRGPVSNLKCLLVDEYQDVNPAQVALIKKMLSGKAHLIVVGDELQCIYNWRGSDVSRILMFNKDFDPSITYRLNTNYRSTPNIVEVCNSISETVRFKDPKKIMNPYRMDPFRPNAIWISTESEVDQAGKIVDIIENFLKEGLPPNQISVLFRSVINSAQELIDELKRRNVPVSCILSNRTDHFINDFIIPILKWVAIEHNEPRNQIEEVEFENNANELWDNCKEYLVDITELDFWDHLNSFNSKVLSNSSDAYNIRAHLYNFFEKCNLAITIENDELMLGIGIASQIIRSVEEVQRRRIKGLERKSVSSIIRECITSLKINQNSFGESIPINSLQDGVNVSTIHQAKGLQWSVVIIPTLKRRKFPLPNSSIRSSFSNDLTARYGTDLDDETRLFFVASSRAKDRLILMDTSKFFIEERSIFLKNLKSKYNLQPTDLSKVEKRYWKLDYDNANDKETIRLGISDLLLFLDCPFQFGLRRKVEIQPSIGDELGYGKSLHELIQRKLKSKDNWNQTELEEQVDKNVFLPYLSETAENEAKTNINQRVATLTNIGALNGNFKTEIPIEIVLDNGILIGQIDAIVEENDGTITVIDWKSNIHPEFLPRYEFQIQIYVLFLRSVGYNVKEAKLIDIGASYKNRNLVFNLVDISEIKIESVKSILTKAIDKIIECNFLPNPVFNICNGCDMNRLCNYKKRN